MKQFVRKMAKKEHNYKTMTELLYMKLAEEYAHCDNLTEMIKQSHLKQINIINDIIKMKEK